MKESNTNIILGPPGTGKTTKLLSLAEDMIASGYAPTDICLVTFTRKGAQEAKQRAIEKFKLADKDLPWWKTLHSLAFMQLGLSRNQIMMFSDYITLCGQLGLHITNKGMSEDGNISGLSKGDRLFFMENMARATKRDLREYWEANPYEDIHWYELERLQKTMLEYKAVNGKQDFTDIIYSFNRQPLVPQIKVLIVDEAQDLTPLQWEMVEHLSMDVDEVHVAGDDDQAIFKWAGADVSFFQNIKGNRHVLPQSYRVPITIQKVAETVVSRIQNRLPKTWEPTPEQGKVEYVTDVEHLDLSEGQWLLLGRNLFALEQYNQHCIQNGYVFDSHIGSPIRGDSLQAIVAWEDLRKGKEVTAKYVKLIYERMQVKERVKFGFKGKMDKLPDETKLSIGALTASFGLVTSAIWHEALNKLPGTEREYFLTALQRGEKLLREPRIKINTIHSVKGGEADNVVICPDMATRTWNEFQENPDDEHRVWYVAITRAKKALYILSPKTLQAYEI